MKMIKTLIITLSVIIFAGCGNLTEIYDLNDDNSGTYTIQTDIVQDFAKAHIEMAKLFHDDSLAMLNEDSLYLAAYENTLKDFPLEIDSIIQFPEPDVNMSAKEQMEYEFLKRGTIFMKRQKNSNEVLSGFEFNFKNPDELKKVIAILSKNSQKNNVAGGLSSDFDQIESNLEFGMNRNKFKYAFSTFRQNALSPNDIEKLKILIGDGNMTSIFRFNHPIKKVTGIEIFKVDANELVVQNKMINILAKNHSEEFRVKLAK